MIIGMTGLAGSGKDTAAKALIEIGWKRFAFAHELKRVVNELFGWDEKYTNNWTLKELVVKRAKKVINFDEHTVIADVRFESEASFVRQHGHIVHIIGRECEGVSQHSSETGVRIDMSDFVIYNTGTIDRLQQSVLDIKHMLMTA